MSFEDVGELSLKNIREVVRAFRARARRSPHYDHSLLNPFQFDLRLAKSYVETAGYTY